MLVLIDDVLYIEHLLVKYNVNIRNILDFWYYQKSLLRIINFIFSKNVRLDYNCKATSQRIIIKLRLTHYFMIGNS